NAGYVAALGAAGVAATDRVAADAVRTLFGSGAARLVTLVILVSIFSAANGMVLTGPRMYFAMARDRVFFRSLADVHPRFGTPALFIAAAAAIVGNTIVARPVQALIGLGIVATGVPAYFVWTWNRRSDAV